VVLNCVENSDGARLRTRLMTPPTLPKPPYRPAGPSSTSTRSYMARLGALVPAVEDMSEFITTGKPSTTIELIGKPRA